MLKYHKIYLGNICNNNCIYCTFKNISSNDLNTILSSSEKIENVLLYGGEPTLRSDIFQIIRKLVNSGAGRIKILTNGRRLSDINYLYKLIDAGCFLFEFKLWGSNPMIHDKITRTSNSFYETVNGLNNLASVQDKFVSVRIPVCRDNYRDIQDIVVLSINFGVNRIILSYSDPKLSMKDALPFIFNSINISIFNRTWILTEGFPFCVMKNLEKHMSEIYGDSQVFNACNLTYHEKCSECVFRNLCSGINSEYLTNNGMEFLPVTENNNLEDIRRLYEP